VTITNPQSGSVILTTISSNATDDKRVAKLSLTFNGEEVALSYGSSASYQKGSLCRRQGEGGH
jgi:hypothetical protein